MTYRYNFPMTAEGVKYRGSKHEDNLYQFVLCYTKDTGDAVTNKRSFMRNCKNWNLPVIGKYTQNVHSSMYDWFESQGLVAPLIGDPTMANATFFLLGDGIDHANDYEILDYPELIPEPNHEGLDDEEFLQWREDNVPYPAPDEPVEPINIIEHPEQLVLGVGQSGAFKFVAENWSSSKWFWKPSGSLTWNHITQLDNSDTYGVRNAKETWNDGQVKAELTNPLGTVETNPATLTVI